MRYKKTNTTESSGKAPPTSRGRGGLLAAIRNKAATGLKKVNLEEIEADRAATRKSQAGGGIAGGMMSGIAAIMARRLQIKGDKGSNSDDDDDYWSNSD